MYFFIHCILWINCSIFLLCLHGSGTGQYYSGCKSNGRHSSCLWQGYTWVGRWVIGTWNNWEKKLGGVKSSVRVLGSACKPHRNSEARTITGGKKSNSSPFERDCKKPLFLSQMSAGNSGSYHPGKDWKQHYVIFHTYPGPIQHSTLWKQHTHHPEKEIKHGLLKVLK